MNGWIHWLNYFSVGWAETMWRAVSQGTFFIVAALVLSRLAPEVLPAAFRSWVWRIVCLKLALALIWVTPIRVPVLPNRSHPFLDDVRSSISARNIESLAPSAVFGSARVTVAATLPESHTVGFESDQLAPKSWLFLIWSFGVLVCSFGIVRYWRQASQLRRHARILENGPLNRLCQSVARELGCKRVPPLMCSEEIRSPVVLGIWKPVILIPATLEQSVPSRQSRMMFAHELAHVRRRDLPWLCLSSFTQAAFFFHPLVWLASRESRLAQEIACDELAVSCLQARASEYAKMLVDVASGAQMPCPTPWAVGVVESYRTLKRRLKAMKHTHSQSRKQLAIVSALTVLLGAGTIVPWQLVAQNPPAAAPNVAPAPPGALPGLPPVVPSALAAPDDEADAPAFPVKPAIAKRKRATVKFAPAAPSVIGDDDAASDIDGEVTIRAGKALNIEAGPKMAPYGRELRSKVGPVRESDESRDQVLRYKLIFKSGLARLRHLLSQPTPDDTDVETAFNLVGKLERQLLELSDQTENRDLKSTGNVIREQLTELNAAVDAAKSEKSTQMRAKRLTRAKAIVEGLIELVPDIDAIGGKSNPSATVQSRF